MEDKMNHFHGTFGKNKRFTSTKDFFNFKFSYFKSNKTQEKNT